MTDADRLTDGRVLIGAGRASSETGERAKGVCRLLVSESALSTVSREAMGRIEEAMEARRWDGLWCAARKSWRGSQLEKIGEGPWTDRPDRRGTEAKMGKKRGAARSRAAGEAVRAVRAAP